MKQVTLKNVLNGQLVICENIRDIEVIDGIEYLRVHNPGHERVFLMRRGALEKVKTEKTN
jgi:hypothetical protein